MPRTYAADLMDEPGLAGRAGVARLVPNRRADVFMLLIALAASATVLVNALALQGGRHIISLPLGEPAVPLPVPAPPEARQAAPIPSPAPSHAPQPAAAPAAVTPTPIARPRPVAAPASSPAKPAVPSKPPVSVVGKPTALAAPPASSPAAQQGRSGIAALTGEMTAGAVRPPADVALSPRVLAVQKALADMGYGPLRIDGRSGAATKEAIERFERDRRLPISGEVSDRVVHELNAVAGTNIE